MDIALIALGGGLIMAPHVQGLLLLAKAVPRLIRREAPPRKPVRIYLAGPFLLGPGLLLLGVFVRWEIWETSVLLLALPALLIGLGVVAAVIEIRQSLRAG